LPISAFVLISGTIVPELVADIKFYILLCNLFKVFGLAEGVTICDILKEEVKSAFDPFEHYGLNSNVLYAVGVIFIIIKIFYIQIFLVKGPG
jgi:hypothetical protein